jgi:hypothetical protein
MRDDAKRREGRGNLPAEQRRQEVQAARCVKRLAAFNRKRRQLNAVAVEYERHETVASRPAQPKELRENA